MLFPKAEGGVSVTHLDAKLTAREAIAGLPEGSIKILAQSVESAMGFFLAGTFRDCSKRLIGLTWGPEDLSAELGAQANREADGTLTEPYRLARAMCLLGAAAAKVPAIETIHVDFRNADVLRRDTELARRDGFVGRLAIHPAQVPVINAVFAPTVEQIEQAKAVIAAFAAQPGAGTVGIGGKMYDRPHLVARAGAAGAHRLKSIRQRAPGSLRARGRLAQPSHAWPARYRPAPHRYGKVRACRPRCRRPGSSPNRYSCSAADLS